jgi:hypothetical protein
MTDLATADPKGLVREAYAIEGITLAECRSILIDWALSLPGGLALPDAIHAVLQGYGAPDHPMTTTLREGLTPAAAPRRRGGRAGRVGG